MRYRMIYMQGNTGMAICTITEKLYNEGGFDTTKHGNGSVKTLYVHDNYTVYEAIRNVARKDWQ